MTGVEITSDPGPDGIYATGEAIEFTATFSNAVTVETSGGTPRLRIDMGLRLEPDRRWAGYDRGTDSTGLVFAYTVAASDESHESGVGWLRNGLELDGGTIGKTGTDEDAVLDHPSESGEPGHLVNWARPMLAGAETSRDGTRVILTYDEDLRSSGNPTNRLSVAVDGVAVALDGRAAVSGRTVTIPLASAVTAAHEVTVTYTDAAGDQNTAGVIEDLVRNDAPSFTAKPVANKVGVVDTLSVLEVWEMSSESFSIRNRMTLSPGFASDTLTYTGTVRGETQYIAILPGTTDDAATVSITPGDRFTDLLHHQVELGLGENEITITVTAAGGANTKEYALTVRRGVPKVSSVAFTSDPDETGPDDDTYVRGDTVEVTVTFDDAVTVTGAPTLELDIGGRARRASYDSGESSGAVAVFSYTVSDGDEDGDGISMGANKLALNGATIVSTANGVAASLSHSGLSPAYTQYVDGVGPALTEAI